MPPPGPRLVLLLTVLSVRVTVPPGPKPLPTKVAMMMPPGTEMAAPCCPPAPVMVSVLMVAVTPLSMVSTLRRLRLPGLGGVLPFRLRDQLPPLGTLRGCGCLDERLWRDRTSCPVSVNLVHADRKRGGVSLNLVCDLGMARL